MCGQRGEFLTPFCAVKNGTAFATLFSVGADFENLLAVF
jgi:hypothetical protein